ncbi:MAG TPA: DnaJ family domain-containing protein [Anaerolineales bacterium]|nr:DnaJ family domain-containing protein [Anaerolineales bacterium]
MENWQKSIDQQIEQARREGKFDNLPGKGKPLKLNENPFQDPAMDAAYTLLQDNDFTLPWIAEGKEIDEELAKARTTLTRSWALYQRELSEGHLAWAKSEWNRAENAFRERISAINKKVQNHNISIPNSRFEKMKINPDREIEKIRTKPG